MCYVPMELLGFRLVSRPNSRDSGYVIPFSSLLSFSLPFCLSLLLYCLNFDSQSCLLLPVHQAACRAGLNL